MHMPAIDIRCYAKRLLNPYQGVAQIIDIGQARAISTDGINWRLQIRSEIYKAPWSSLAIPAHHDRFFVYGIWSQSEGLARIPVHPSLYQEHVEQAAQDLLAQLSAASKQLPFPLQDNIELWLMDAAGKQPVALIASLFPEDKIPSGKQLHWYPTENADTVFTSDAFAAEQARATIKSRTQDYLQRLIRQRCNFPFQALWIERQPDGSGHILYSHTGKSSRQHEYLEAEVFPPCLLDEHWPDLQSRQLVTDYINWQAPLLLMLPLPEYRRCKLEQMAQQQALSVHRYHRLYPEVIDNVLLNKILVEAVLRKASQS